MRLLRTNEPNADHATWRKGAPIRHRTEDRTSEERDTIACRREHDEEKGPQQRDNDGGQNQPATAIYRTHTMSDVMFNI
jgi:hypothetical protein